MKIMIIDDNLDLAESLRISLETHECTLAHNARKASEILAKETFDLVITDINMPFGGGERILCELSHKPTPVFVYTGNTIPNVESKYKSLGADKVFIKPDALSLIDAIESLAKKFI